MQSVGCSSRGNAVIDFAADTAAVINNNALQSIGQSPKVAPSQWGYGLHQMRGYFGRPDSPTKTASRSVHPFLGGSRT